MLPERYYTPIEVAAELDVTPTSVYRWIAAGELIAERCGPHRRILPRHLKAFLRARARAEDARRQRYVPIPEGVS